MIIITREEIKEIFKTQGEGQFFDLISRMMDQLPEELEIDKKTAFDLVSCIKNEKIAISIANRMKASCPVD